MIVSTFPKPIDRPMTVAELIGRHPTRPMSVSGDVNAIIGSISNPEAADPASMIFIDRDGPAAEALMARTRAGIIVRRDPADAPPARCYIQSDDPRAWFIAALSLLYAPTRPAAVDPSACVDPTAKIGRDCRIGPFAVIGADVEIGEGASIGAHSVILAGTRIGARAAIQHHVILGSEGVAFHRDTAGLWHSFPHQGRVLVDDDVAIGSQTVIARGMLQDTIIGKGSKIGNFVNIGHNCSIGANCWLSANVVLTGGARLEDEVRLAASVSIKDLVTVGRGALIGLGSVVTNNVPSGATMFGNPARPLRTMRPF